jgi:hypothetical protein
MITITIGSQSKNLNEAHESWIAQEIQRLRQIDRNVCVRVTINDPGINVTLATPGCTGSGGGGGRAPNEEERNVLNDWRKRGMEDAEFAVGNLIAFLKQLRH